MTIFTNSLIVHGSLQGVPLNANTVTGSNPTAPLSILSDIEVNGSVFSRGRVEISDTMFLTMRPSSNIPLNTNERFIVGDDMAVDPYASDASSLSALANVMSIWNWSNGTFVIPVDGLYNMEIQGSFSNTVPDAINGVYWYLRNQNYPNARVAANIAHGPIANTSTTRYFLKDDIIQPAFYSSDSNAILLANGETYVASSIFNTLNVDHSKYYRQPA